MNENFIAEKSKKMSDILQYKALSNKIEKALNEKVIGDVRVDYNFNPSIFSTAIIVSIDDPSKKQISYHNKDNRYYYRVKLDEFIVKDSFDNEEETSKLISEIVSDVLDKYKEYVYKKYFFD